MSVKPLNELFSLSREETLNTFYERVVTIPITARTALKRELTATIGEDRAKGIFIRYGWHCGVSDGERAMSFAWDTKLDLIKMGPNLHVLHGYLDNVNIDRIEFDKNKTLNFIDVSWFNSFEADEYLKRGQYSDHPVCHNLCGYASGYLSTVVETPIYVKETKCKAMGHEKCEVVCRPMEKWGEELENEYRYYQSTSMIQELDEITEKLKIERDYLNQAHKVHRQLIEELLSKKGLQRIVDLLYSTTGLPAFVENEYHQVMVKSDNAEIDFDLDQYNTKNTAFFETTPGKGILRTPIFLEQKIKGYCSFIYSDDTPPTNLEYMIIDQASLTASIMLLNESIEINTEQNIRRGFLSDILENKLETEELFKIAYYLQFNPDDAYWMFSLEKNVVNKELNDEIEINEELVRYINLFFKNKNVNAVVSQKLGKIVALVDHSSFEKLGIKRLKLMQQLIKHCAKRFSKYPLFTGISSVVKGIDQIPALYEETKVALQAKNKNNQVQFFEQLGIESILFQIPDEALIDRFVEKQLGRLLEIDKNADLAKTLYAYVENGVNINNTAKALSMSISGLRYRLSKISESLDIDLDDTKSVFSVYMALNILKAKGQLDI
jgi:PucR family transcriptional regulator, purine catabolism regulatory protein